MRALILCALAVATPALAKINPLKPRKYKCIEVTEDDNHYEATHYAWRKEDEQLKSIGKMRAAPVEVPEIRALTPKPYEPPTPPPSMPTSVPRDHLGRPLILSPQHCAQVKKYADMYGVTDVLSWVKRNCHFAKMFLPDATCDEVNILVASCYKNKFLL